MISHHKLNVQAWPHTLSVSSLSVQMPSRELNVCDVMSMLLINLLIN